MSMLKTVRILLVDDDSIDRRAIVEAFKNSKVLNPIVEARHGEEALEILREKPWGGPFVVLLDINMPVMDGHEFLKELREDSRLKRTIVFVLTSSQAEQDLYEAYGKNVAGYILKENVSEELTDKIRMLDSFMLSVEFPKEDKT